LSRLASPKKGGNHIGYSNKGIENEKKNKNKNKEKN
jgi:hypothetical protein